MSLTTDRIQAADHYLDCRTGCYEWRCERYSAVWHELYGVQNIWEPFTLVDVGAGWTELDAHLRDNLKSHSHNMRYLPVDACIDGVDLNVWEPPRQAEVFVALEVVEHIHNPRRLIQAMQEKATRAVMISTPNPETTDVLGMDHTHVTPVTKQELEELGFDVAPRPFYGKLDDSLFGVWVPDRKIVSDAIKVTEDQYGECATCGGVGVIPEFDPHTQRDKPCPDCGEEI